MTSGSPPRHRWVTGSRTLADGETASRERLEKLFGTVSETMPTGVKLKNRPNSRSPRWQKDHAVPPPWRVTCAFGHIAGSFRPRRRMVPALSPNRPEPKENRRGSSSRADPGLVRPRLSKNAPLHRRGIFRHRRRWWRQPEAVERGDAEHKMRASRRRGHDQPDRLLERGGEC
jgi:hypothetical protein